MSNQTPLSVVNVKQQSSTLLRRVLVIAFATLTVVATVAMTVVACIDGATPS